MAGGQNKILRISDCRKKFVFDNRRSTRRHKILHDLFGSGLIIIIIYFAIHIQIQRCLKNTHTDFENYVFQTNTHGGVS